MFVYYVYCELTQLPSVILPVIQLTAYAQLSTWTRPVPSSLVIFHWMWTFEPDLDQTWRSLFWNPTQPNIFAPNPTHGSFYLTPSPKPTNNPSLTLGNKNLFHNRYISNDNKTFHFVSEAGLTIKCRSNQLYDDTTSELFCHQFAQKSHQLKLNPTQPNP